MCWDEAGGGVCVGVRVFFLGGGCKFNVRQPDFPRAYVVNSVHYSTVYLKRGPELVQ